MLAWLFWRLERIERIHAVAGALISEFGAEAYAEARQRERDAHSEAVAQDWRRVGSIVARRLSRFADAGAAKTVSPGMDGGAEPAWIAPEPAQPFRIQFVCGTVDRGPTNLTEKRIRAADASAAIVAAANTAWPPRTIGLRILDREGREVFAREKGRRR
jgi:hypothetical protein